MTYHEFRFWSSTLGVNASRLAIVDKQGGEHFAIVPMDGTGRANREARREALEAIADHVDCGLEPGPVELQNAQMVR